MPGRGVLLTVDSKTLATIRKIEDPQERYEWCEENLVDPAGSDSCVETDKAWDAIHRCLGNGELIYEAENYPLDHAILGGEILCDDAGLLLIYKTPEQVKDVARALATYTMDQLREAYFNLDPNDYTYRIGEEDWGYTADWFSGVPGLYARAAAANMGVIFSVEY